MVELRFNVFGRLISVVGGQGSWRAFYLGNEGKRRPADFIIPKDLPESGLCDYLADLFHEFATQKNSSACKVQ